VRVGILRIPNKYHEKCSKHGLISNSTHECVNLKFVLFESRVIFTIFI